MTSLTKEEGSSKSTKPASSGSDKKTVSFFAGGSSSRGRGGVVGSRNPTTSRKPAPKVNIKQENLGKLIEKKKECEKKAHEIVLRLIEPGVGKEYVIENAANISKQHMEDVIEERKLSHMCGWVLCDNTIDPSAIPKKTYSIRGHKVFDITERKSFCSGKCYAKASHFKEQLSTSPLWLRDLEEEKEFEILEDENTPDLQGLTVSLTSVTLSDDDEDENENDSQPESSLRQDI